MIAPTEIQTILQNGKPAFVVIPYREYLRLVPDATKRIPAGDAVPHEVMRYVLREDFSLARAWREYLGYTQVDVAARMGITQSALAQMEISKRPRKATLEKLAAALGVSMAQLV
ncbi:MAG TPA: helix-turn-helix transcriptional regulator [Pseudomonadales bacterium]|jgi:DNA-binding XRE family transcriptional regulator|nr:helix-turn-helix transcriptional regulator [Pseudomonadales bacterium]HNI37266.1 helix-turn-helix transcriptional regulator [Pseudomonadales bacterium]